MMTTDSRKVVPGSTYIAIRGAEVDGHQFITQAIQKGASQVIVDSLFDQSQLGSFDVDITVVECTRDEWAKQAVKLSNDPSGELFLVGVTGTNGKTSVTYMIEHLLKSKQRVVGVMGTVDHHLGDKVWESNLTTPDPVTLNQRLREFVIGGAEACVMEVSSHALDQKRADHLSFDVGVFTNLSRDHFDYHLNFESYLKAKARLFIDLPQQSKKEDKRFVFNGDDKRVMSLVEAMPLKKNVVTFGRSDSCSLSFEIKKRSLSGQIVSFYWQGKVFEIETTLLGEHNVENWSAALLALLGERSYSFQQLVESVPYFGGIPGRVQRVPNFIGLNIFIDYAHTSDALEKVLFEISKVRKLSGSSAQIITVFGCGGDRDKGKRPKMGAVAQKYSDQVVVTSDNPRHEDPEKIMEDIVEGMVQDKNVFKITKRQEAIKKALELAAPQDVILIAGKGHEDYQMIGDQKNVFDDYQEVLRALQK